MTKQILIDKDLLNELICAQHEIIENYRAAYNSHIGVGKWNDQINDLIETYNQACILIGIEKKELVPHA